MSAKSERKIPWFFVPFVALWDLIAWIISLIGRLFAAILGFVFLLVGIILTVLIVTAPIGIPLVIVGLLLLVRSIF